MDKAGHSKAIFVIMLAAVMLTAVLSADAAVSVALSPVSGTPGTSVTVAGTADPETWITLKVLDETGKAER